MTHLYQCRLTSCILYPSTILSVYHSLYFFFCFLPFWLYVFPTFSLFFCPSVLVHLRTSWFILFYLSSWEVVFIAIYVWDGMVIIGHRSSISTFGAKKNIKTCPEKDFTFSPTENYPFLLVFQILPLLTSQTGFHSIFTWRRPWKKWEPGPIAYSATWKTIITKAKNSKTLGKG